jgi:hypothetical protein
MRLRAANCPYLTLSEDERLAMSRPLAAIDWRNDWRARNGSDSQTQSLTDKRTQCPAAFKTSMAS